MTDVSLTLEAGEWNGIFDLTISDMHNNIAIKPSLSKGVNKVDLKLELPNKLIFELNGKNNESDTLVDTLSGQVLRDKYIRVTEFIVDQKPFDPNRIAQMFTLLTEHNETVYSSYWGFNGTVELDMPYKSSLEYHLSNLI